MNVTEVFKKRGVISISDRMPKFKLNHEVFNCFGYNYENSPQTVLIPNKLDETQHIWIPKLPGNDGWENQISLDGLIITEICKKRDEKIHEHYAKTLKLGTDRVTFVKIKDALDGNICVFKGVFRLDKK